MFGFISGFILIHSGDHIKDKTSQWEKKFSYPHHTCQKPSIPSSHLLATIITDAIYDLIMRNSWPAMDTTSQILTSL